MKLRNILLILAAITFGFASCSSESDILSEIDTPVNGLDEETVAVSFNLGNDLQTKANNETQDASYDEATINNCVIAIFDHATKTMLAKREFTTANGLERNGNTYTITNIETKAIPSDVIVVANCPVGFFNNVVTKEGFNQKIVTGQLTDKELIKVWKSEEGMDLKLQENRNIQVKVNQLAARIDLQLNFENKSNIATANFIVESISMQNINNTAYLFPSNNIYPMDNFIDQQEELLIALSSDYQTVSSFYSYPSNGNDKQAILIIRGTLCGQQKSFTIKVKGSDNVGKLESGYLYQIQGTVVYKQTNVDVELKLQYEVIPITKNEITLPEF